jgi:GntR family transcriptional regulator/MocR family aminotransferase
VSEKMQLPLRIDPHGGASLQDQLVHQVVRLIRDGRLRPGVRMPSTRQLASDLRIARNTAVIAYERLVAEGWLQADGARGHCVSESAPLDCVPAAMPAQASGVRHAAPLAFDGEAHDVVPPYEQHAAIDFWVGRPDGRLFPVRAWRKLLVEQIERMDRDDCGYGHPAGLWPLREAIAAHVGASRGIRCDAADVIVTAGIQEALNIVARLFIVPGGRLLIEEPGYRGAALAFASYGARLVPLPVDAQGLDVAALPQEGRVLYVTPSHQYPTGATLAPERRAELLDWAQRAGAWIVEDDYDSDFVYDAAPLPALKAMDRDGLVIYLGTFSKSLAPSLRIGYMVVPVAVRAAAIRVKSLATNCSPWLLQAALSRFLASGAYERHIARLRRIYARRRDRLLAGLRSIDAHGEISGAQAGMHVLWKLRDDAPLAFELERAARAQGVGVYGLQSGNAWVQDRAAAQRWERALMLGYAALEESEIAEGVRILARLLGGTRA